MSGFGLYLGKKSERLVVRKDKTIVYQFPFFRIQEVVVASKGISLSADLLEELCIRGIRINFWGGEAVRAHQLSLFECDDSNAARSTSGV